ncbi:hypothetical protein GQ457_18G008850 [Hibiscus cannabinus]
MANNTISLRSLLEKEKLNGINFLDWFRNLRIVLKQERKEYAIEEAVPNDPGANTPRADKDKFKKHIDDMLDVGTWKIKIAHTISMHMATWKIKIGNNSKFGAKYAMALST